MLTEKELRMALGGITAEEKSKNIIHCNSGKENQLDSPQLVLNPVSLEELWAKNPELLAPYMNMKLNMMYRNTS